MKTPILLDPCRTRAQLQPAPLTAVTLKDEIWAARRARNLDVTLPSQYRLLEETGRIDNFRRAAGREALPFRGRVYNDSDVYKWLEAASWMLATDEAPALAEMVATVVAAIEGAQAADGY
ncbi:MAG: glycoside hydrolase family 127 protein, partial [Chloroflexi bacterium]|nr:glycoside hydrolase family 127 protein [Chloroflexota bacterium]